MSNIRFGWRAAISKRIDPKVHSRSNQTFVFAGDYGLRTYDDWAFAVDEWPPKTESIIGNCGLELMKRMGEQILASDPLSVEIEQTPDGRERKYSVD